MTDAPLVRPPSTSAMQRCVQATRELLGERSFQDIAVADIVTRAGLTVESFEAHFEDKDAVLGLLLDQLDERIRGLVRAFCDPVRWDGAPVGAFVAESVKLDVHAYRRSAPLFRAGLAAAATDPEFRERRRATMQFSAEAQKRFLLSRRDELSSADAARSSDAMFEMVAATLDHELLYGRFTLTSPTTDGELIDDLTRRALAVLGAAPADLVVVAAGI